MPRYKVFIKLEKEFDDIKACNEDEAFEIATNNAIDKGIWEWDIEEITDEKLSNKEL